MFMHEMLHSRSWPTKILYHVGNKEALLGWRTSGFDLYIVFDPLIIKTQAILLGNKLIKWISVSVPVNQAGWQAWWAASSYTGTPETCNQPV